MGTYYIPRNVKGETRILYIFTIKALITTAAGAMLGILFYFIFAIMGLKTIGIIFIAVLSIIGYGLGMIKIPTLSGIPITKKIGGDPLSEIIMKYIKFKKGKKRYTYTQLIHDEKEESKDGTSSNS